MVNLVAPPPRTHVRPIDLRFGKSAPSTGRSRVQHDAGILRARLRGLRRSDISAAWEAVYGQFDIGRSDLHPCSLTQAGQNPPPEPAKSSAALRAEGCDVLEKTEESEFASLAGSWTPRATR